MEAVCEKVHRSDTGTVICAEVVLPGIKPRQYLPVAQRAMEQLRWQITAVSENAIEAHTGDDIFSAAMITVKITADNKITLEGHPLNEYYSAKEQAERSISALKQTITTIAHEVHLADRNLHPMHREKYGALLPSKSYLATPLLVYANVLVFIAMVLSGISILQPTAQSLYLWGGNLRAAATNGEPWRLLTYIFLHGGAMHLIMNTFALLYIGMFLEPLMGRLRFTGAYLIAGVCAGLMSIAMHPASVGVGASGAIFGMYGVFLSLLTTNYIKKTLRKTMLRSILFFVLLNLLYGLQGNTDNAAHIGGLLSGIVIGYAYYPGIIKHHTVTRQVITTLALTITMAAGVSAALLYLR